MIKISIEFSSHPLSGFIVTLKPVQNSLNMKISMCFFLF